MRRCLGFAALLATACPSGDDTATGEGSSTGIGESTSTTATTVTTSETSTSTSDTVDTTCADACATTGTSEGTTAATTNGSSSGSSSGGPEGSTSSAETSTTGMVIDTCGDGVVDPGEDCDDTGASATCDADCTVAECGDATLNTLAGELCDAGGESFNCDVDCTLPSCGDGVLNLSHNELCDGGGETAACDDDCTPVDCGDGNQNIAALETCDDGNNNSNDGCSASCVIEGNFGGQCRIVDGVQWCFDNDNCGQACDDVCTSLGLTIEPDDMVWASAQDSAAECQAISDAFGLAQPIDFGDYPLACLEDAGQSDLTGGGLTGGLRCSSDPMCPAAHRADMDDLGTFCDLATSRRSVCPCAGIFCGNGVIEGTEECDDGNQIQNDGCTTFCSTTPPTCQVVNGTTWCFDNNACGEACDAVCDALGFTIVLTDAQWFAAQDTMAECQDIADAFGMAGIQFNGWSYACLEDSAINDSVGGGLTGQLFCSSTPTCPSDHHTMMDQQGIACGPGARRSICPCG